MCISLNFQIDNFGFPWRVSSGTPLGLKYMIAIWLFYKPRHLASLMISVWPILLYCVKYFHYFDNVLNCLVSACLSTLIPCFNKLACIHSPLNYCLFSWQNTTCMVLKAWFTREEDTGDRGITEYDSKNDNKSKHSRSSVYTIK